MVDASKHFHAPHPLGTERNLSIHTCWHHDVECSSDLPLRCRETASRIGALVHTFCAHFTFVGDEKDVVAAVRGDKHAKDELGGGTEEDAMAVHADDGDIIQERRACPYVLSSPHLGRRLDDSLIHVLTRATDQDEVAASGVDEHGKGEVGDETVEQVSGVLAGDDLAANKDRIACPFVLYVLLIS